MTRLLQDIRDNRAEWAKDVFGAVLLIGVWAAIIVWAAVFQAL